MPTVDLDRGTFLPIDVYNSDDIEDLADEVLGPRRRQLLDELRAGPLRELSDNLAAARRLLEANSDQLRSARRRQADLIERIEAQADARAGLEHLPPPPEASPDTEELQSAAHQARVNRIEQQLVHSSENTAETILSELTRALESRRTELMTAVGNDGSKNQAIISQLVASRLGLADELLGFLASAQAAVNRFRQSVQNVRVQLEDAHLNQEAHHAGLREKNQEVSRALRDRAEAEEAVQQLKQLEAELEDAKEEEAGLLALRGSLRASYLELTERVSLIRDEVAQELQQQAGRNVRIRVRRNADNFDYCQIISESLHGVGVRNHDAIVEAVARLRPDELAQILQQRDYAAFEQVGRLGLERSHRVLDGMRDALDPLSLDTMSLNDKISIELDTGIAGKPLFKDAGALSKGQKCTAILPIILARRIAPLVVDQPEDNLDNHFIFRTVVESIQRLKAKRQMLFITHNANIPVLAEAELVVVMGSDGNVAWIEKKGTLDDCRLEIIDLLEGGEEAFEKRRRRYERH